MSPPTEEYKRRVAEWDTRLTLFSNPKLKGSQASAHFRYLQNSMIWQSAIGTHLRHVGDDLANNRETRHSSRIAESINPSNPGVELKFKSSQTIPGGRLTRTVVTVFWSHRPGVWEEPKEPRIFLENSLFFDKAARETAVKLQDVYDEEEKRIMVGRPRSVYDKATDAILTAMFDYGYGKPCGSLTILGQVTHADPDALLFTFAPPPTPARPGQKTLQLLLRWRLTKDGLSNYFPDSHSPSSSYISSG